MTGTSARRSGTAGSRRPGRAPSPLFIGIVAVAIVSGWALWAGVGVPGWMAFLLVLSGWVVSLCLHEFAHALSAYRFGDESVAYRGYLTLDPLRYTHVVYSLILPLVFVILGGIGLPGGAVFVDRSALKSRFANAAVSAAGPLTNVLVAILLAIALVFRDGRIDFWSTIAFLLFLQVTGAILNLLPVPGLDGFGIVEPYLPRSWIASADRIRPYAVLLLFGLLWIPAINRAFFSVVLGAMSLLGTPDGYIGAGYELFRFWVDSGIRVL